MDNLILASKSPRRKEILYALNIPFIVFKPISDVEKSVQGGRKIDVSVIRNSRLKVFSVTDNFKNGLILSVDTVVCLGDKVLEKPSNKDEAKKYLKILSGRTHFVYSGISLVDVKTGKIVSDISKTKVSFKRMSNEEINYYISTNEWYDKAGGYAIQGKASFFIKEIRGSFYNVVGLPVELLYDILKKFEYFKSNGQYTPLRKL